MTGETEQCDFAGMVAMATVAALDGCPWVEKNHVWELSSAVAEIVVARVSEVDSLLLPNWTVLEKRSDPASVRRNAAYERLKCGLCPVVFGDHLCEMEVSHGGEHRCHCGEVSPEEGSEAVANHEKRPEILCSKGDDCWCGDVRECGNASPPPPPYEVRCPHCGVLVATEYGLKAAMARRDNVTFPCEPCASAAFSRREDGQ